MTSAHDPSRPVRSVVYLHGFASSAKSTKAEYFAERLLEKGITLRAPDFNRPDFASLTMTRMLDQVSVELSSGLPEPIALIGSSLGGTLAILSAERFGSRIDRLVLFAPAVMFAKPGHHLLPPERVDEWRRSGEAPFFHYGYGEERRLKFSFFEDTSRYDAFGADIPHPMLIFQGLHDTSVDYRTVERFASQRPSATLSLLDDDHQLIASLPRMWADIEMFLGLVR